MKTEINRSLLPIKAHFFFFFAALGPVLPQLNVFGRQLGVSPAVMGMVTAVLPLLWVVAKPLFGYVVDFWPRQRKLIFMLLITLMTTSYCCLWFIPEPNDNTFGTTDNETLLEYVYNLNDTVQIKARENSNENLEHYNCHWSCAADHKVSVYLSNSSFINTIYVDEVLNDTCSFLQMDFTNSSSEVREGRMVCSTKQDCNFICVEYDIDFTDLDDSVYANFNRTKRVPSQNSTHIKTVFIDSNTSNIQSSARVLAKVFHGTVVDKSVDESYSFYASAAFWSFVVLVCVGTVAFNVANCIGDAVCFDVLGPENSAKYGSQRLWGTAGYGVTALIGGWLVDQSSAGAHKHFAPAFIIAIAATIVDLYSCRKLNLPALSSPSDSGRALRAVLRLPRVLVFITFAVVAGIFDSFIIYYMFWFLEELAEQTGYVGQIKLIEGVVIAGQSFLGEIVFFALAGKIITRFGYGVTLTFSLLCYGVRMALVSVILHPWHLVFIESVMQGPTYALCYSAVVGYAAEVAPPGYSATVQGLVAGMDDGLGFALGSLIGGQVYSYAGGRGAFRVFAAAAAAAAALHAALFTWVRASDRRKHVHDAPCEPAEGDKMLAMTELGGAVYRDTVVPANR